MIKHTPGPWQVEYDEENGEHTIRMGRAIKSRGAHGVEEIVRYDHGLYADEEEYADQFDRACANARLIATAPEMLAALLAISTDNGQDAIEDPCGHAGREMACFYRIGKGAMDEVRRVIKKAGGTGKAKAGKP